MKLWLLQEDKAHICGRKWKKQEGSAPVLQLWLSQDKHIAVVGVGHRKVERRKLLFSLTPKQKDLCERYAIYQT